MVAISNGRKTMKLSSKTHYGLMACHVLGKSYPDKQVSARELEGYISVSGKYLEKIMRMLSARGVVAATRGANGGYSLAKPPEDVTIGEIVRALEDDMVLIDCLSDNSSCKCCPSSAVWRRLYDGINELLDSMTLKQMIDGELRRI